MSKNRLPHVITIAALVVFVVLGIACESTPASNNFVNAYSNNSEQGIVYTFYNYSSQTVTISDPTGSTSIAPGGSQQVRFNSSVTVSSVRYSPSSVKVSQSGSGFFFED